MVFEEIIKFIRTKKIKRRVKKIGVKCDNIGIRFEIFLETGL